MRSADINGRGPQAKKKERKEKRRKEKKTRAEILMTKELEFNI